MEIEIEIYTSTDKWSNRNALSATRMLEWDCANVFNVEAMWTTPPAIVLME